ncbi:hypothetical protein [Streptomyces albofaciens]|uniref:hypothetical protein n=1 Tax=Streptomyces albofaciens TaxID=66866 RepID=UPI001FCA8EA5|nr:hypothetical protein [Streptomyces albofaciens]
MVPRSIRTSGCRLAAVGAAPLAALVLTGCSVDAKSAAPAVKTFPFTGRTLNVKTHEIPADLVATDRRDIKVTRWFDAKSGAKKLRWELTGQTLDLEAGCTGLAICDARFKVEVPRGVTVLRDGARTDLNGGAKPTPGGDTKTGARNGAKPAPDGDMKPPPDGSTKPAPDGSTKPAPHGKDHPGA